MRALFGGLVGGLIGALAYVTYVTVPNIMTYLVVVRAVELLKKMVRAFKLLKNRAEPGRAFQNTRLASLGSSQPQFLSQAFEVKKRLVELNLIALHLKKRYILLNWLSKCKYIYFKKQFQIQIQNTLITVILVCNIS